MLLLGRQWFSIADVDGSTADMELKKKPKGSACIFEIKILIYLVHISEINALEIRQITCLLPGELM